MMKEVLKCPYEASIGVLCPFGGFINSSAKPNLFWKKKPFRWLLEQYNGYAGSWISGGWPFHSQFYSDEMLFLNIWSVDAPLEISVEISPPEPHLMVFFKIINAIQIEGLCRCHDVKRFLTAQMILLGKRR